MVPFATSRISVNKLHAQYGKVAPDEYDRLSAKLRREARDIFKRANKQTNRNGEAGELLLYLLTEWILEAPQLLAKMPLKTNPNMPVHGSDGIHVKYCSKTNRLLFYWGESKLYADVNAALDKAVESMSEALTESKLKHEYGLVARNIDFSGLDEAAQKAILLYLDPLEEQSNERANVLTCLIGFDFAGYVGLARLKPHEVEDEFKRSIMEKLPSLSEKLAASMEAGGLADQVLEIFFFPVPSVQQFRDVFQAEIGWNE